MVISTAEPTTTYRVHLYHQGNKTLSSYRLCLDHRWEAQLEPWATYVVQLHSFFSFGTRWKYGLGSSVGIATDYGLDGPGSNPGGDEISRPFRLALGPTQPPVKWVPGLSRGKVQPGHAADHSSPSSAAIMEE